MYRRSDISKNELMMEELIIGRSHRSRTGIPSTMMRDTTVASADDTHGTMMPEATSPQKRSLPGILQVAFPSFGDSDKYGDETNNTLLLTQSCCPYSSGVGQRYTQRTSESLSSSKSKITFPSLTVSITVHNSWSKRNRRRHGRFSLASLVHRNRHLPTLISFACLLMTISTLYSTIFLKKQQALRYYQQQKSVDVLNRSSEQQQQIQLYRRRQLRISSKANAATTTEQVEELFEVHYLSFGSSFASEGSVATSTKPSSDPVPYPYLLDASVQAVVLPTSSSRWLPYSHYVDFVAACTQSLVDSLVTNDSSSSLVTTTKSLQQVPDVITIEYTFEEDLTKENYLVLTQRLRRRYPNAIIVLVQLLQDPSKYLHLVEVVPNQADGAAPNVIMNFQQWKENQSFHHKTPSTNFINDLVDAMFEATTDKEHHPNGHRYWTMIAPLATTGSVLTNLFESDPHILHYTNPLWQTDFAFPHASDAAFKEQMSMFWNHFSFIDAADTSTTSVELSTYGHVDISLGVRKLVEMHFRNELYIQRQQSEHHDVGDWGSGDDCHIWYTSGDYRDIESTGGRTVTVPTVANLEDKSKSETVIGTLASLLRSTFLSSSSVPHKHALEFSRTNPSSYFDITSSNNNYIVVNNPFTTSRLLSLSYLTDSDGMSYPKTLIVLNDIPSVQIQPIHELSMTAGSPMNNDHYWQQTQHVAKTSCVGYIPPGKSTVRLIPLQNTILPFRVVGVSILAEELHHSAEYAFEMDVTAVSLTEVTPH